MACSYISSLLKRSFDLTSPGLQQIFDPEEKIAEDPMTPQKRCQKHLMHGLGATLINSWINFPSDVLVDTLSGRMTRDTVESLSKTSLQ